MLKYDRAHLVVSLSDEPPEDGRNYYKFVSAIYPKEPPKEYIEAAERGSVRAQYELAYMYDDTFYAEPDVGKAAKWYSKAARWLNKTQMHWMNDYISRNIEWHLKAAEQGFIPSQLCLCWGYLNGITRYKGPNRDQIEEWLRKSAGTDPEAEEMLNKLLSEDSK